jgi:hypothetical protein
LSLGVFIYIYVNNIKAIIALWFVVVVVVVVVAAAAATAVVAAAGFYIALTK